MYVSPCDHRKSEPAESVMKSASYFYEIPISQALLPSRIFRRFRPSSGTTGQESGDVSCWSIPSTMNTSANWRRSFVAPAVTPELMSDVMANACVCVGALESGHESNGLADRSRRLDGRRLALLGLELPQWKLRRFVHDDGSWLCSLSKQPGIPLEHDEVAEASHETLPLAILIAFLQARRDLPLRPRTAPLVPPFRCGPANAACCDNFA